MHRNTRPSLKDIEKIKRLYTKGSICREVATKTGWSAPIVERIVREAGLTRIIRTDPSIVDRAERLLRKGLTVRDIERKLKRTGLAAHLRRRGLLGKTVQKRDWECIDLKPMVRTYQKGNSLAETAKLHKVPPEVLRKQLNKRYPGVVRPANEAKALRSKKRIKSLTLRGESVHSYVTYERTARSLSRSVFLQWKDYLDPFDKLARGYHIDHKLSIRDAFMKYTKPLPLKMVCHPCNLQVIPASDNRKKRTF